MRGCCSSQHSLDKTFVFSRGIIVCALSGATGVILAIIGGARGTSATTWDEYNDNVTLRHVAIILFIILFSGMLCIVMYCWMNWNSILRYRRRVSLAICVFVHDVAHTNADVLSSSSRSP